MSLIFYSSLYEPLPYLGDGIRIMRTGYLGRELIQAEHKLHLWLPSFDHVNHQKCSEFNGTVYLSDNLEISYLNGLAYKSDRSLFRYLHNIKCGIEFSKSVNIFKLDRPDVVIAQIPSIELAYQTMIFAKKNYLRLIVDIRDPYPDNYRRLFSKKFQFLYPFIFKSHLKKVKDILDYADGITAVSDSYLHWALRIRSQALPVKFAETFHIGYDHQLNIPLPNDCFKDKIDGFVTSTVFSAVFAGTFESNIDAKLLLDLVALLDKIGDGRIKILIAGKGPGSEVFSNVKSVNLMYLGWLKSSELNYLYKKSHVAVIPYSLDALQSLPNKPFECMAYGLPLINQLRGELNELIISHDFGFNIRQGDVNSLYRHLKDYTDDSELYTRHSKNSLKCFSEKFTAQSIYPRFVKFIEKVIEHGSA
jgi:glycosyltransferase involved in cell wall biosynthesis